MAKTKSENGKTVSNPRSYEQELLAPATTPNPVWFKPVMVSFMLIGLVWIIVFYISESRFPIQAIGAWNIAVGFGITFIGFLMTTRWR